MDTNFQDRARRRREAMVGGVAHSHAELDELDFDFWQRTSPSERLEAVWQLAQDAMMIRAEKHAAPRLQGPAFGIRRREG